MLYLGLKLFNVGFEVVVLFNGWLAWDVVGEGGNLRYALIAKQIAAASLLVFAHVKKFFVISTRKTSARVWATVGKVIELSH